MRSEYAMSLRHDLILWFALYAAIGCVGTWLARRYALQRRLIDQPGERRSHAVATPRGGGIAIVAAVCIAVLALIARQPSQIVSLTAGLIGFCLVAVIGWVDDHRPLSPWLRLAVHAVAATVLASGLWLGGADLVVAGTAGLLCMALVNVWNFMDGIDGIAVTQAAIVALAFGFVAAGATAVLLALALIASICGFLPFNLPKARIFLGDVGSGALGYVLAWLAALAMAGMPERLWLLLLLPLSAFLLDAGLTLSSRIVRGEQWWLPHVEHVYQRWARRTGSHPKVTAAYALWTGLAVIIMGYKVLAYRRGEADDITLVVLAWLGLGIALWYGLRRSSNGQGPQNTSDRGVDT
jgi:UDP-N-acetylmuramyl pentapeptide phosphotransferase/UDP-N-acetylglucosamine-1-phosphate transferase